MKNRQPILFVSHGAPSLLINRNPTTDFFDSLGKSLIKPEAIVSVSAHWETTNPLVTGNNKPETIHDFYGFQDELYKIIYPCPGSITLAKRISEKLVDINCKVDEERGLDHGAWVPLKRMFPNADIPVVQVSIQTHLGPHYHYKLGQYLRTLSEDNILIVCSGSATHNIHGFSQYAIDSAPQDYVLKFDNWLSKAISNHNIDSILNYRSEAPYGKKNHPTEEHFLPLIVALGAAYDRKIGKQIHSAYTHSILSMAAYLWE